MKLRVKIDDQTFEVEVGDINARPVLATVDGETFQVWPEEAQAAAAQPVAVSAAAAPIQPARPVTAPAAPTAAPAPRPAVAGPASNSKTVIAPIPGTIVTVAVEAGAAVTAGQELCSLEAMKMKNSIRATRAGSIAKVFIKAGDRVSQGQALVEYAE